jgi:hypothetical protein
VTSEAAVKELKLEIPADASNGIIGSSAFKTYILGALQIGYNNSNIEIIGTDRVYSKNLTIGTQYYLQAYISSSALTTTSDSDSYSVFTSKNGSTTYYYRMWWGSSSASSTSTGTNGARYPSSGNAAGLSADTTYRLFIVQMNKISESTTYSLGFYSSLHTELGARATISVTTAKNASASTTGQHVKSTYTLNGKNLFVDYNSSATYRVSYSSSFTTGSHNSPTYNLNNLYGTATIDGTTGTSKAITITADKAVGITIGGKTQEVAVYVANTSLQSNSAYTPKISFYTCKTDNTHTIKNLTTTSGGSSAGASHTMSAAATLYVASTSNKLAAIAIKAVGTANSNYSSLTDKKVYIITTMYGNYLEITRGDTASTSSRLLTMSSESATAGGINTVTNNSTYTGQPQSIKGHKLVDKGTVVLTYAPYI